MEGALPQSPPPPLRPPPRPPEAGAGGKRVAMPRHPLAFEPDLPTTNPPGRQAPVPKDLYMWIPAVLALIGLQCQRDRELAERTGVTMRHDEDGLLEFVFVGINDIEGQYLCRYVRAMFQRLGKQLSLSSCNALMRHLRDHKTWNGSNGLVLHNVALFWNPARGGNPLGSAGQRYVERQHARDESYYHEWHQKGQRKGVRPAPTQDAPDGTLDKIGNPRQVDSGQGGLPGATMQLARLLQDRLDRGYTAHGKEISPQPHLFTDARKDVEFLGVVEATAITQALCKRDKAHNPGSLNGLTQEQREKVLVLKGDGDKLMKANKFAEAAANYQRALELHPTNKVFGKLADEAKNAVTSIDHIEAQVAARGGSIGWADFAICWHQVRPSRLDSSPRVVHAVPIKPSPGGTPDGVFNPGDFDLQDFVDVDVLDTFDPMACLDLPVSSGSEGPMREVTSAEAAFVPPLHEATLSDEFSRTMSITKPDQVEWTVQQLVPGVFSGWEERVLQLEGASGTMRLCEARGPDGNPGAVIEGTEKQLHGCTVGRLKKPRNHNGPCPESQSAFRLQLVDETNFKMVAVPDAAPRDGDVWHTGKNDELKQLLERLSTSLPTDEPLLGKRKGRGSRGTDYQRPRDQEDQGSRSMSPARTSSGGDSSLSTSASTSLIIGDAGSMSEAVPPPKLHLPDTLQSAPAVWRDSFAGSFGSSFGGSLRGSLGGSLGGSSFGGAGSIGSWGRSSLEDLLRKGGWLYKAGAYNRSFKKRFFRLEGSVLRYYEAEPADDHEVQAKGEIDLDEVSSDKPIVPVEGEPQRFKLITEQREWELKWEEGCTGSSAETWRQGLLGVLRRSPLGQRFSELSAASRFSLRSSMND